MNSRSPRSTRSCARRPNGRSCRATRRSPTHEVTAKAEDDVVTIADHESEAILAEGLATLLPEAAIVGEEAAFADPAVLDRLGDALCWIIDPLDGTNNFAAGKPPFGVLVALAEARRDDRRLDLRSADRALLPCGARQGRFHRRGAHQGARERRATADRGDLAGFHGSPAARSGEDAIAPHYRLVDIPRCAAEQYPRLVLGQNDVSIFERTLAWDHAAGVLFLNEAGGKAARPDGSPYRAGNTSCRACSAPRARPCGTSWRRA